jgi:hypothetical protein
MSKKSEKQNQKPPLTFTEDEVKKLASYMNFVNTHAEFTVKAPQMQEFIKLTSSVIHLMKKCEGYIFEITEHYPAPEKES